MNDDIYSVVWVRSYPFSWYHTVGK